MDCGDLRDVVIRADESPKIRFELAEGLILFARFFELIISRCGPFIITTGQCIFMLKLQILATIVSKAKLVHVFVGGIGEYKFKFLMCIRIRRVELRKLRPVVRSDKGFDATVIKNAGFKNRHPELFQNLRILNIDYCRSLIVAAKSLHDVVGVVNEVNNEGPVLPREDAIDAAVCLYDLDFITNDLVDVHGTEFGLIESGLELVSHDHDAVIIGIESLLQGPILPEIDLGVEVLFGIGRI